MFGLIGAMRAEPGQRDAVIAAMTEGSAEMPGCLSYVIATDPEDAELIWITELWDSEDSHRASLALEPVKAAIAKARPMIAGFDFHKKVQPVAVHGAGDKAG